MVITIKPPVASVGRSMEVEHKTSVYTGHLSTCKNGGPDTQCFLNLTAVCCEKVRDIEAFC